MKIQKRLCNFLFFLFIPLSFSIFSCNKERSNEIEFNQYGSITETSTNYTLTDLPEISFANNSLKSIPPKISIPDNMLVIQTLNLNIDSDDADEQIISVKKNNDPNSLFKILIADYLQPFDYHILSSELLTQATNVQNFQVLLIDVEGDKNLEIVCTGFNKDEGQTIDIFKYDPKSLSTGLKYTSILSLSSTGSLELLDEARTGRIQIERQQEEDSPSDLIIRELFTWNPLPTEENPIGSYQLSSTQSLRKKKVSNAQLRKVIESSKLNDKFDYLKGQWILEETEKKSKETYLFFNLTKNQFNIYADDYKNSESSIENFIYQRYRRLPSNRFRIEGVSGIHDFKYISIVITYLTMTTILVDIYDNDSPVARSKPNYSRSGTYRRVLEEELVKTLVDRQNRPKLPEINGIYNERLGKQYIFEYPYFRIKGKNDKITHGGYAIYDADVPILEMQTFNDQGIVINRACYKFSYHESQIGRKTFKTITLIPGKLTLYGFEELEDEPIKLQNEEFSIN